MTDVITRFPPSPTGHMHVGNIRSLLFNYFYARKHNGKIVMRFEDTDKERSKQEYADEMLKDLELLGLDFDSGPFYQSQRTDKYAEAIQKLIETGNAFMGEESNDGGGQVVRFKNPNKEITFRDEIRGDITIDTTDFGDFVIARSLTNPLYHLTVVVDDIDGGITHVIRGEDHVTSTPRQILLIEALGGSIPQYAHLPLIVGDDKKKLGKRHGAVYLSQFLEQGYLPAALINYLALLGWNPGDEREVFSKDELVTEFSLERVQKSPATFSYTKLQDINKQHMSKLEHEEYIQNLKPFVPIEFINAVDEKVLNKWIESVVKERISHFGEVSTLLDDNQSHYLAEAPTRDEDLMSFKDSPFQESLELIHVAINKLEAIEEKKWNIENIKAGLWDWTTEVGRGNILHPMRTILSGQKQSPDPFTLMYILGKEESIKRLSTI